MITFVFSFPRWGVIMYFSFGLKYTTMVTESLGMRPRTEHMLLSGNHYYYLKRLVHSSLPTVVQFLVYFSFVSSRQGLTMWPCLA